MNKLVSIGALYHHYRNPQLSYKVLHLGLDEATTKPVVIYQAQYSENNERTIWVRPLDSWTQKVVLEGGRVVDRFTKIE